MNWNGFVPKNDVETGISSIWPFWALKAENPVFLGDFDEKSLQLIKVELIFIQNHIREKKFGPKFKGRGHVTPYN